MHAQHERPPQTWRARSPRGTPSARGAAVMAQPRRPKPWPETNRQDRTRYVWRFQDQRYWTNFYDDPEEARADATNQITEQIKGSWHERTGRRMLLEDWIDVWVGHARRHRADDARQVQVLRRGLHPARSSKAASSGPCSSRRSRRGTTPSRSASAPEAARTPGRWLAPHAPC